VSRKLGAIHFDETLAGINNAVNAIDRFYADALDPNNGEFLMQLIGVLDDPFAIMKNRKS